MSLQASCQTTPYFQERNKRRNNLGLLFPSQLLHLVIPPKVYISIHDLRDGVDLGIIWGSTSTFTEEIKAQRF